MKVWTRTNHMSVTGNKEAFCWPRDPRQARLAALALWALPMLVIGILVALRPLHRTVTPIYHHAAANWWAGQNLYDGPQGMNYLPHFAVIFSLFHLLPLRLADVVWRLTAVAMLAGGLYQLSRALFRSDWERPFFWATLVAMPLCLAALRNGQANATFGGLTLLAAAAVLDRRWWLAAGLMALATAVKPLGVVLMLLAPVYYVPLRWRLAVALCGLAVFPFLFGSPSYVVAQYREALANLQACAVITEHRFADFNGLLRTLGAPLSPAASKLARVVAGGVALGLWWWGAKRLREPFTALWLYSLTTAYLMLFNPMNELNSYVILAPALGIWAAWFLLSPGPAASRSVGWALVAIGWSMGFMPNLVRPVFGNLFALFWLPLMTLVMLGILISFVAHSHAGAPEPVGQPA